MNVFQRAEHNDVLCKVIVAMVCKLYFVVILKVTKGTYSVFRETTQNNSATCWDRNEHTLGI